MQRTREQTEALKERKLFEALNSLFRRGTLLQK